MKEVEEDVKTLVNIKDTVLESKKNERYSLKEFLNDLRLEQQETA